MFKEDYKYTDFIWKKNLHSSPVVCGHINTRVYAHKYMWVYGKDLCPQSQKSSRAAEFSSTCFFLFCFFETQNLEVLGKKVDAMSLQDDVWIEYFFL